MAIDAERRLFFSRRECFSLAAPRLFQTKRVAKRRLAQLGEAKSQHCPYPRGFSLIPGPCFSLSHTSDEDFDNFDLHPTRFLPLFQVSTFFRNLRELRLESNPLTSIPKAIQLLSKLSILYLGNTGITTLENDETFGHPSLKKLVFWFGNLTTVGDCAFCGYPNLTNVILYSQDRLSSIHENAFGRIQSNPDLKPPKIESFSIHCCNISILPKNLLDWDNLKELYLIGNPFMCNCSMAWLIDDLAAPKQNSSLTRSILFHHADFGEGRDRLKCFGPTKFKNKLLTDVGGQICENPTSASSSEGANTYFWWQTISIIFAVLILVLFLFFFCNFCNKKPEANFEMIKLQTDFYNLHPNSGWCIPKNYEPQFYWIEHNKIFF